VGEVVDGFEVLEDPEDVEGEGEEGVGEGGEVVAVEGTVAAALAVAVVVASNGFIFSFLFPNKV